MRKKQFYFQINIFAGCANPDYSTCYSNNRTLKTEKIDFRFGPAYSLDWGLYIGPENGLIGIYSAYKSRAKDFLRWKKIITLEYAIEEDERNNSVRSNLSEERLESDNGQLVIVDQTGRKRPAVNGW